MIMAVGLTVSKIAGRQGSGHNAIDSLSMQIRTIYCIFSENLGLKLSD